MHMIVLFSMPLDFALSDSDLIYCNYLQTIAIAAEFKSKLDEIQAEMKEPSGK